MKNQQNRIISRALIALVAGSAFAFSHVSHGQNVVLNGNFATGDFTDWTVTETGTGGIGTVTTVGTHQVFRANDYGVTSGYDGTHNPQNFVPLAGNTYGAYFNPAGGVLDLTQTIDLPTAGTYTFTAWVQALSSDDDYVNVSLGGTLAAAEDYPGYQDYTEITGSAFAAAGPQVLDFQFIPNSAPVFIDDITLTAAPDQGPGVFLSGLVLAGVAVFPLLRLEKSPIRVRGGRRK